MGTGCVMDENLFRGHPPEKSGLEQEGTVGAEHDASVISV